ncbi:hypothetical protein KEM55_004498 [Ascosphaera atra]|nr:hypothetical protein KEM55_004498 [Ascosphaera atra]
MLPSKESVDRRWCACLGPMTAGTARAPSYGLGYIDALRSARGSGSDGCLGDKLGPFSWSCRGLCEGR